MIKNSQYDKFLERKQIKCVPQGFDVDDAHLNSNLFDFQRDIVKVALRVGKFCIWASTGLGKTLMSLSWADAVCAHTGGNVLILAPLGVAKQTVKEGEKFGIEVQYCAEPSDVRSGINITNYDRLHKFDADDFIGVVIDESSCLKDYTSSTRNQIIDAFQGTQYKLSCSATPAPNDYMELGNQCEFLGVMTRAEMLAMFFTHDGGDTSKWRLKRRAEDKFWQWVCTWAVMLNHPKDLGYKAKGYDLPPLQFHSHEVRTEIEAPQGSLFHLEATSLTEQRNIRKKSMGDRCQLAASLANSNDEQWLIWCELNDESALVASLIDGVIEVKGSDSPEFKEQSMLGFADGNIRVLVTKPSIAGMGMNFQSCHNVIYIGLTHSFEQYFQSVRRVWRFGQEKNVHVHIIQHPLEGAIVRNLQRKEAEAKAMSTQMVKHMQKTSRSLLQQVQRQEVEYNPAIAMVLPSWLETQMEEVA